MKKVTHMVGTQYKNGQIKSEIKAENLINYYENVRVEHMFEYSIEDVYTEEMSGNISKI